MTLARTGSALPSVERARALLAEARSTDEVKKIRAVAQAVATLERGKEIACDAGEIIVLADTRRAELEAEEIRARAPAHRPSKSDTNVRVPERERKAQDRRAPLLRLPEPDRERYFAQCRKALVPPTTMGAAALAKLEAPLRKKALTKLGDAKAHVPKAIGEVKLEAKRALAEEFRANPVVTPDGRYQVIVADPPWRYDTREADATHRGKVDYPDLSTEEICALPVAALAQKDAILWLWTTNSFMRDAFRCLDAWGFLEKTILTWDKEKLGVGNWLRNVTEHCILAVRGKPLVALTNQSTMLRAPRREHSRKPDEFYALVDRLCPGSKLELFARARRDGWTAWGGEPERFAGTGE